MKTHTQTDAWEHACRDTDTQAPMHTLTRMRTHTQKMTTRTRSRVGACTQ